MARRIRLAETWPRVPSAWAKWLTRSSSSSHGTSRSAAGSGRPAGQAASRARVLAPRARGRRASVEVGRRRVRQPLEPARGGAQVALDVGQPRGAGRGDEARVHEPAELALDVLARGRSAARAARAAPAARSTSRAASRIAHDLRRRRRRPLGQAPATCARSRAKPACVPRRAARLGHSASTAAPSRPRAPRRAAVRRGRERELRGVAEPALDVRGSARARRARAAARAVPHRRALRRRRLEHAHADARRPRRPAPGSRAPPGRCPAARRPSAARRSSTRVRPWCSSGAAAAASAARSRGRTCSRSASRSVALGDERAALVLDAERHAQVRREPGEVERVRAGRARRAARSSSRASASSSGSLRGFSRCEHRRGDLGHRHERAAQLLRQRADQRGDQLRPERRARASRTRPARAAAAA